MSSSVTPDHPLDSHSSHLPPACSRLHPCYYGCCEGWGVIHSPQCSHSVPTSSVGVLQSDIAVSSLREARGRYIVTWEKARHRWQILLVSLLSGCHQVLCQELQTFKSRLNPLGTRVSTRSEFQQESEWWPATPLTSQGVWF